MGHLIVLWWNWNKVQNFTLNQKYFSDLVDTKTKMDHEVLNMKYNSQPIDII